MGAERKPDGHEPDEGTDPGPVPDPASIDWSAVPVDDPRWELLDEIELDDDTPSGAPPDPSQRSWRHPSEVAAANAHMERFLTEDASRQHPASQFGGQYRSSPVGNGRVILAFAAGALVIAAISIWSNSPDSVISDTAAAVSIVSSPPELGLAQGTAVASLGETPIPTTTTTEVSSRSAQALYAETVSPPPPWAFEVLSGNDGLGSSTLATAIRIDGLTPEFLITSASALGQRREVMLKGHASGREQPELMPALVVGSDSGSDIAVLRVGVGNETPFAASIGSQDLAELGSAVEIRSGVPSTAHSGTILSMTADVIETSAPVPTGHLGAAVVNAQGRVIGVVVDSPSMLASAIPVAECQRIAANIADYGVANPNWLGITITMSDGLVEVVDVVADGPADRAGISVGDRLLGAGGSVVITPDQLGEIVAAQAPDTPLEMVVDRGGSVSSVAVTVGQKPKASLSPSWVDT